MDIAGSLLRHDHPVKLLQGPVHSVKIHFDDVFTSHSICLVNRVLDGGYGFVCRQDAGKSKETRLHNCVDPAAQTDLPGKPVSVNNVKIHILLDKMFLDGSRERGPHFGRPSPGVEQKGGSVDSVS